MKKFLTAPFTKLFFSSLLLGLIGLSTGCVVRPGGYGYRHHHHGYRGY